MVPSPRPIDSTQADLSLRMTVSNRTPVRNDLITRTVFVTNWGSTSANGVQVQSQLPAGLQFESGAGWTADAGGSLLSANMGNLSAGVTVSLSYQARVVDTGYWVSKAQITAVTPGDPNSTPGNGLDNGEDDTARADFRVIR